ncbi:hypothetical protein FNF27_02403 [Cafeteria roenbergensis]|uniref:Complex 1 LYR protein domain-containing protein n=1 Tax=Cafeteria roenbergensis TaxID=33653 RepID=A0A5A8DPY5_CAFRO|nr:hypothetical protein FNF29_07302 [Cafeteria roenbergensis]KAA0160045.1 hypothetical protein FNF27_08277 [Cafeteria roenbergensis]KAA0167503.1 hypothetical protein FNF31_00942 [Cafeteria roenbergensis]KAA0172416.1 hypothetical protein FNF28_00099 [Cafeteria roenbergensis]KAA0176011.1 hypothetical protein FNF27_02403 [Cafeteria roenbergensis]|eukprot:KAA0147557.1 hypothetical protein FNF29_07302 [Cafeteria roenbergensis]
MSRAGSQRLSGLQRDVLALYRECLRAARAKPSADARQAGHEYVRAKFREHASIRRADFMRIEFLIRQGRKQLDMFGRPDVDGFAVSTVRR